MVSASGKQSHFYATFEMLYFIIHDVKIICSVLTIANGVTFPESRASVSISLQYFCNAGYTLIGDKDRLCQNIGRLAGFTPRRDEGKISLRLTHC